jgi:hypothetical protein
MRTHPFLPACYFAALLFPCSCTKHAGQPVPPVTNKPFLVFNAMQYQGMPDLTGQGLRNVNLINETSLFTSSEAETPDSAKIAALGTQASGEPGIPVIFDIEAWPYTGSGLQATIDSFLEVIRVFKQTDTGAMGFYGVVPNDADTWENIEPAGGANYVRWQQLNTALTPIADKIDLFFPSFYTHDNDTTSWSDFVTATLGELQKYNVHKPVYAFLWPQYHDGSPDQYQFLDTNVWKFELKTLFPLVDGIVIWSSSKITLGVSNEWSDSASWWIVTEAFMAEHQIN